MRKIRDSFKFIWAFAKMQLSSGMMYRFSFWGTLLYTITTSLLQILMFDAIARYGGVEGWTKYQLYIFTGTFMIVTGLSYTFTAFGLGSIPDRIRTGTLDFAKTKPVSTLIFVTYGCPDMAVPVQILFGMIIVLYCAIKIHVLNVLSVLLYILALAIVFFLLYAIQLLLFSISFWTVKSSASYAIRNLITNFANKLPAPAIKGVWRVVLYVIFPVGLITNLPCNAFMEYADYRMWIVSIVVTGVFYGLAVLVWKKGLKSYDSASS